MASASARSSLNNIPVPPPLKMHSGEIASNWKRFKAQWTTYELATDVRGESKAKRAAILLSCIGADAYDTFQGMVLGDDARSDIDEVIRAFDTYCIGETNTTYERYLFNRRVQEASEKFDGFVTELRRLIRSCDYGELEDSILKDRIVIGVRDDTTRRKMLQTRKLDLNQAIDICRASEMATKHLKEMTSTADVHKVDQRRRRSPSPSHQYERYKDARPTSRDARGTHREFRDETQETPRAGKCKYCGKKHEFRKELCSAYGKVCSRCGFKNHFAIMCTSRAKNRKQACNLLDDESDSDSIFAVNNRTGPIKRKIFANLFISDTPVRFQIDCGATINLLPLSVVKDVYGASFKKAIRPSESILTLYDGSVLETVGMATVTVANPKNQEKHVLDFYVTKSRSTPILGAEACQAMMFITINYENIAAVTSSSDVTSSMSLDAIEREYGDIFKGYGKFKGKLHLHVDPSVPPVRMPLRRLPIAIKDKVKAELDELTRNNIIAPVNEPSEWISALLVVAKPKGGIRLCIDPKPLNKALLRNHHLMPTLEDVLPDLTNAKVFSAVDASHAFWHVELDDESSKLTVFETPFGRYRWRRLCFGISVAPEEFQSRLQSELAGLKGIKIIADDILIYGSGETTEEATIDHDKNLRALFDRARLCGLKLNLKKLQLRVQTLAYMGHTLSPSGIQADKSKIIAIQQLPAPADIRGVQRLLGMATYLAKFVPNFSELTAPIRMLLDSKNEFKWTDVQEAAFEKLKALLSSETVLQFYDIEKPVIVQCDSSQNGLGCVLLQDDKPIAFASRALTKTETAYCQMEKELLAIVFAMERFHTYVYGRKSSVITDHRPLISIAKKSLIVAPRRLQRMLLRLQRYDFDLIYRPGSKVIIADTLSRAYPAVSPKSASENFNADIANMSNSTEPLSVVASDYVVKLIRDAAESDELYIKLRSFIRSGWPAAKNLIPDDLRIFYSCRDEMSVEQDLIFKGPRLYVPFAARAAMIERSHSSHIGLNSALRRVRECIFWPRMTSEITEYITRCNICNQLPAASPPKEPLISHAVPVRAWEQVGVDLFQIGNHDYLITVDYTTNFFEIDRLETKRSSEVIYKLKAHFARHGLPLTLISDGGPCFSSNEFRIFLAKFEVKHIMSSPIYPRSNGKAECCVKTCKRILKRAILDNRDPYLALLDWRNAPSEKMGLSPAQLLFGRRTRTLLPMTSQLLESNVSSPEVRTKIFAAKAGQKKYHDRTAKDRSREHKKLVEGQTVRVKLSNNKDEWRKALIAEKLPHRSYVVKTEDGSIYRRNSKHVRFSNEPPIVFNAADSDPMTVSITSSSEPPPPQQQQPQQQRPQQQPQQQQPQPQQPQPQPQHPHPEQRTRSGRVVIQPLRYRD
jgi:hypothetical protein